MAPVTARALARRGRPADAVEARDAALLALHAAGLSPAEIRTLRVCDAQTVESVIEVRIRRLAPGCRNCARGASRYVVLEHEAAIRVRRYLELISQASSPTGPLFAGQRPGEALSEIGIRYIVQSRVMVENESRFPRRSGSSG